ncbi:MAG: pantetheine-phosphate adenylyltransferase [Paludibacteraceae bacterium]|jgi:pantetheine-phosphate adenylyltransferase|nr:pantetheine-phosphate adenylyltransferase [Paludibacteraceae bacterium]MDI9536615.1 pantetheine-phosphate adenylyltransferase [Bacteroidota bacterium]HHT61162.1 pantetheine-phosphate adenylyltransferase [Bacteroidales bacterium]MBP9039461.1 pantetheine-phosphate adenylyltransferase [Paludibacteraceae bacterium]HRR58014.1 pantetheine-phosphate adenylyltransferase [Paludibacteraceae bacterium]
MKTALFPGSFDPFSIGHQNIVQRGLCIFDKIVIGIGRNTTKQSLYTEEERKAQIEAIYQNNQRVSVAIYDTLTVDFTREIGANFILRGVRTKQDFDYEQKIAEANRILTGIETVVLFAEPETKTISSSLIRELKAFGKDISDYLPQP